MSYDYKLTAIVLVYNGGSLLEECLDSLVNQTLDALEILLINDASTDNSLEVCRRYERNHDNVFVIDKEKNEGLATSANLGINMAKGEYVILVDNDDYIPKDAYKKLYEKAKKTDSDICIGKANFLTTTSQYDMNYLETYVWQEERTINNVNEFPEIFHDAFYWNKIMKRDFLLENDIGLPHGMIYADRNFSHKAYVHAKRISIIPDCVYLWRIRQDSLSMKKRNLDNYINRIDSYEIGLDEITDAFSEYFKILLRRIIIPIRGLLDDEDFEEFLFTRVYDLIVSQEKLMDDIYDNDLDNAFNIILYFILNKDKENLRKFLKSEYGNCSDVMDDNGESYWNLPQFRNPNFNVPDEFFKIKYLESQFFRVDEIKTTKNSIVFANIRIPKHYLMKTGYIIFKMRTTKDGIYEDNWHYFEIKKENEGNVYSVEIPLKALNNFKVYDIYFKSINEHQIPNEFRIEENNISDIVNSNKNIQIDYSSSKNLKVRLSNRIIDYILKLKNKMK